MKRIIREPLFHFLLIGALLFFITTQVNKVREQAAQQIAIDSTTVGRMVAQYQSQMEHCQRKKSWMF
jgi:hypothetical protein